MQPISPQGLAMRQKIALDAATPQGFCAAHYPKPARRNAQYICSLQVAQGLLHRVRFSPRKIRYFDSREVAAAQPVSALPPPRPVSQRKSALTPAQQALRAFILRQAAAPEGFTPAQAVQAGHPDSIAAVRRATRAFLLQGLLHLGRAPKSLARYYSTAAAAQARESVKPPARVRPNRIRPPKPKPKAAPLVRRNTPTDAQQMQVRPHRQFAPGTPKKDAITVWPDHYPKTVQTMPPPRNQVVSIGFFHDGYGAMR